MAALDIATHKLAHAFKEGLISDMGPVFVGRDALPPPGALSQLGALLAQDRPPIAGSSGLPPCSLPGEASRVVEATRAALSLCRRISEEVPEEEVRGLPGLRLCSYLDPYLDPYLTHHVSSVESEQPQVPQVTGQAERASQSSPSSLAQYLAGFLATQSGV